MEIAGHKSCILYIFKFYAVRFFSGIHFIFDNFSRLFLIIFFILLKTPKTALFIELLSFETNVIFYTQYA